MFPFPQGSWAVLLIIDDIWDCSKREEFNSGSHGPFKHLGLGVAVIGAVRTGQEVIFDVYDVDV